MIIVTSDHIHYQGNILLLLLYHIISSYYYCYNRENLIQCTSLKLLYLNLDHDEGNNDTRACQITLRNFRIASMLGTFSNLQKLIIHSRIWGDHLTFYPDFIDAIRSNGFKNLKSLRINVSLLNADDKFINLFIESISEYCVELEHLIFFGGNIMIKKNLIQVLFIIMIIIIIIVITLSLLSSLSSLSSLGCHIFQYLAKVKIIAAGISSGI